MKNRKTMTPITNDEYAKDLLYEAARMMQVHCPRSAQARLRRIAANDAFHTGVDYHDALRQRQAQLNDILDVW